jgi:WhiB family transcriptional regulator, redox-sensing transcriptional regulator
MARHIAYACKLANLINNIGMEEISGASHDTDDKSWQIQANCLGADPDLFFPERGGNEMAAKEICRGCVVREECLEYSLANGEKFGIWGGMTDRERRRLRRSRALGARSIQDFSGD